MFKRKISLEEMIVRIKLDRSAIRVKKGFSDYVQKKNIP